MVSADFCEEVAWCSLFLGELCLRGLISECFYFLFFCCFVNVLKSKSQVVQVDLNPQTFKRQ